LPGKIMTDDSFRLDTFVAQAFYLFDLRGAQSCRISRNFVDSVLPYFNILPFFAVLTLST
jgi:hypothetical protein